MKISKKIRLAGKPVIGIFWIIDKEIIPIIQDLDEIKEYAGFKDSKYDHISVWPKIQRAFPKLHNIEYDEIERGRITYNIAENKFMIFVSRETLRNKNICGKILYNFNIPKNKSEFKADIHYTTPINIAASDIN